MTNVRRRQRFGLRIEPELMEDIKAVAATEGVTVPMWCRDALRRKLDTGKRRKIQDSAVPGTIARDDVIRAIRSLKLLVHDS